MRRDLWIGLLLALLTFGVYWPVRMHDFVVYDDPDFITENPEIQSGLTSATIKYAFAHAVVGNWHPVTTLSHALDCELFGLSPAGPHLVNALVHCLNAALLFLFLRQLARLSDLRESLVQSSSFSALAYIRNSDSGSEPGIWLTAFGALLFALHPLRVESVAWIAERKDVLSGFFFLLSLWFYARYAATKSGNRESGKAENSGSHSRYVVYCYICSLVCFALGLMSKPMVVTLPFVLLLLDFWPARRFQISNFKFQISNFCRLVLEKAPFFLFSAIDCWITLQVQTQAGAMKAIQNIGWTERLANAVTSVLRYLGKFVWPTDLAVVYPHPAKHYFLSDAWPHWQIVAGFLLLILLTLAFVLQIPRRPYLLFGWLWFLGTLVPVIGLVQVGEQAMADRYTYIPLIGPVISLVWLLGEFAEAAAASPQKLRFAAASLFFVLVPLTFATRHQLAYWQNSVTLFDHTIAVTADNPSAQFGLGVGLEKQGDPAKAMVRYRVATAIDPRYIRAYYNLAQLLRKAAYWQAAANAYESTVRLNPSDLAAQLNLASTLPHVGRNQEAITHFETALQLDTSSIEALNNLAWLLATSPDEKTRNGPRAVQLAERACELTGSKAPFLLGTLAAAYAEAGRFTDAVQAGEQACARATELGDLSGVAKNKELLEFYRANRPYRDSNNQ